MSVVARLKAFENRNPIGIYGLVIAIVAVLITFWLYKLSERRRALVLEVVSSTDVVDVNEEVANLEIRYRGQDINSSNRSLRLLVLRIAKEGNEPIRRADFDPDFPVGFRIVGEVVDNPRIVSSNRREHASDDIVRLEGIDTIYFRPTALNPGDWIHLKVLAITRTDQPHSNAVVAFGFVAGVDEIEIRALGDDPHKPRFWDQVTEGSLALKTTRFIYYIGVLLVACLVGIVVFVICFLAWLAFYYRFISAEAREGRRREHIVSEYRRLTGVEPIGDVEDGARSLFEFMLFHFRHKQEYLLENALDVLSNPQRLNAVRERVRHGVERSPVESGSAPLTPEEKWDAVAYSTIFQDGDESDETIVEVRDRISRFLRFLDVKGYYQMRGPIEWEDLKPAILDCCRNRNWQEAIELCQKTLGGPTWSAEDLVTAWAAEASIRVPRRMSSRVDFGPDQVPIQSRMSHRRNDTFTDDSTPAES